MPNPKSPEAFFERPGPYAEILRTLRRLALESGLVETVKWGHPAYTEGGSLVAGIAAFKAYAGIWFFQGALLGDAAGVLVNAQEGKTQAMRQWRFGPGDQIDETLVSVYLREARELALQGRKVVLNRDRPVYLPEELERAMEADPALRARFDGMSTSCRREYADYVGEAKRPETRVRRVEKVLPMIRAGGRLNEGYSGS